MSKCYFLFKIGKNKTKSTQEKKNLEKGSTELSSDDNRDEKGICKDVDFDNTLISPLKNIEDIRLQDEKIGSKKKDANKLLNKKRHSNEKEKKVLNTYKKKLFTHTDVNKKRVIKSSVSLSIDNYIFKNDRMSNLGLDPENLNEKKKLIEHLPLPSSKNKEEINTFEKKTDNKENYYMPSKAIIIDNNNSKNEHKSIQNTEKEISPIPLNKEIEINKIESKNKEQLKDDSKINNHFTLKNIEVRNSQDKEAEKIIQKSDKNLVNIDINIDNKETNLNNNFQVSNNTINTNNFFKKDTNNHTNSPSNSIINKSLPNPNKNKNTKTANLSMNEKDISENNVCLNNKKEKESNNTDLVISKKNSNSNKVNISNTNHFERPNQSFFNYNYCYTKDSSISVLSKLLSSDDTMNIKDSEKNNGKNVLEDYFQNDNTKAVEKDKDYLSETIVIKKHLEKKIEPNTNPKILSSNGIRQNLDKVKKNRLKLNKQDIEIIQKGNLKYNSFSEFYKNSFADKFLECHISNTNKKKLKFLKKFVEQKEKECFNKEFFSLYSKKYSKRTIENINNEKINYLMINLKVLDNEEKTIVSSVNLAKNIFKSNIDEQKD